MVDSEVVKKVLEFLEKDLDEERLTSRNNLKRNHLIRILKDTTEQQSGSRQNSSLSPLPDNSASVYIDLEDVSSLPKGKAPKSNDGSGSGYESYASDEDVRVTSKRTTKEDIDKYFAGTNSEVSSFVFIENKTFLNGKKWMKRVGVVCAGQLQFFKKLGDVQPVLEIPLKECTAHMTTKEGSSDMIVNLEKTGNDSESHRFYVIKKKANEWRCVLQRRCFSIFTSGSLPISPATSKSIGSPPAIPQRQMQRQGSLIGVTDIGKGLKSAVSDIFKKDKMKKKISVAEQMGASLCGNLGVHLDGKWTKKLCLIKSNQLFVYGKEELPEKTLYLPGCDLQPCFEDQDRMFTFKLTRNEEEVLFVETSSSSEMGKWVGMLIAETGCAEIPETENIYVEPEVYESYISTARKMFSHTTKSKNNNKETAGLKETKNRNKKIISSAASDVNVKSRAISSAAVGANVKSRAQMFEKLEKNK